MNYRLLSLLFSLAPVLGPGIATAQSVPDKKDAITEPKQVLAGMPREVMSDLRYGSNMEDAAVKATAHARKSAEGKTATLKMTVQSVEKFQRREAPDVTRIRLRQSNEILRDSGLSFSVFLMSVMDESQKEKLDKVKVGSKVTLTGKISNAEILPRKNLELHIDLMDAKLE